MIKTHQVRSCFYMTTFLRGQHTKVATRVNQNDPEKIPQKSIIQEQIPQFPAKRDDKELFPTKLKPEENSFLIKLKQTKLGQILLLRKTSENTQINKKQGSSVVFSDEEPIEIKAKDLVKLDLKDPSMWHAQDSSKSLRELTHHYLMLSKSRLTLLVCITSAAGYGLASSAAMTFDPVVLFISTLGVGLTSAAANSINQILEVPFDSQMNRTRNRILVKGLLTPWHAMAFAIGSGTTGALLMWNLVNPSAALLSLTNLVLYTSVYTPMKRLSIYNTWVGSIVGAIPPVIGWVSATGSLDLGALVLGGILYTWQFPHFNSLSWNLRPDYSRAGYRMMSVTDPELCKRVALRHSIGCVLVCSVGAPLLDVTSMAFALDSLPLNAYLVYLSWKFYQDANSSSSRKLFRYTLVHLPLLMVLMFVSRKRRGIHSEQQ